MYCIIIDKNDKFLYDVEYVCILRNKILFEEYNWFLVIRFKGIRYG